MQDELTNMMDSASKIKKQSHLEREAIEKEWIQSMKNNVEALTILQDLLVLLGVFLNFMLRFTFFKYDILSKKKIVFFFIFASTR
jgi:hypothetical protein